MAQLRTATTLQATDTLSEQVYWKLLDKILSGALPPNKRIGESAAAAELRCSRTPLREALLMLERDGMTVRFPERGFFAAPIRERDVREIYPVIAALEQTALQSAKGFVHLSIGQLKECNQGLNEAGNAPAAVKWDTKFHQTLIQHCQNQYLKSLIEKMRLSVRRFELLFMNDIRLLRRSVRQHVRIIESIEEDDLASALQAVLTNWNTGMESILKTLMEIEAQQGRSSGEFQSRHRAGGTK